MDQDTSSDAEIRASLRAISVGSYLFQTGVASRLSLHPTDLAAIYQVGRTEGGVSAGDLSSGLGLTSGATTAVIDRLVRRGYLRRTTDEHDRRRVVIQVHPQGIARLRAQYDGIDRRVEAAIDRLSSRERATVARFLSAIATDSEH